MAKNTKTSGISTFFKLVLFLVIGYCAVKVGKLAFGYLMAGMILAGFGLWGLTYLAMGVGMIALLGFVAVKLFGGSSKKR